MITMVPGDSVHQDSVHQDSVHQDSVHQDTENGDTADPVAVDQTTLDGDAAGQHAESSQGADRELRDQKFASLGLLAGGLAHDFNNFLTGILGNAQLLMTRLPAGSDCRPLIQEIESSARHAAELADKMLSFAGRGALVTEPLDLSSLIRGMAGLLESSVPSNAHLTWRLDEALPSLLGDAGKVRQLVMQLVLNAIDALGTDGGYVCLATGVEEVTEERLASIFCGDPLEPGPFAFLEVSDTGCGMDEATRDKLFDPFFTSKSKGRGLGMATVFGIIRSHGGGIRVESAIGGGSNLRVFFPISASSPLSETEVKASDNAESLDQPATPKETGTSKETATSKESATSRETASASSRPENHTVLVVDDEYFVRTVARGILEDDGFQTMGAADGLEALELFRQHQATIDLVLLDLTMPGLNGHQVFHRLRELSSTLEVVITSGSGDLVDIECPEGCHPPTFLRKPYRPQQLVEALQRVLDS